MNLILQRILETRLIAVLRLDSGESLLDVAGAVIDGGIDIVEITLTTPGALGTIATLALRTGVIVGAGTVMSAEMARRALDAGAHFCASPITDADVISTVLERGAMMMPGALTPTEIVHAHALGADLIKIFPVPGDAAKYIASIHAPLPHIRLAPSGGVSVDNGRSILNAGAAALNIGSWLTHAPNHILVDTEVTRQRAAAMVTAVAAN